MMKTIVTIAFATAAAAQVLVPQAASNNFPACALSCSPLLDAQSGCIPPAAPVTDQAIYVSCFCQSTLLTTLHSSPDGTCDQWCPVESDRQELMAWYNNFCVAGGAVSGSTTAPTAPVASTLTVAAPQTTVVYITSTSPAPTTTATPSDSASSSSSNSSGSWIDTHWKWILMVAILIVALGGLAFLAVWLKRRHKRKAEEKRAALSGFPIEREKAGSRASTANLESLFGPAQHMAATRGWEYPDESNGPAAAAIAGEKRRFTRNSQRHSSRRSKNSEVADTIQEVSADRSRSRKRRDYEKERERNKAIERGLRGAKGKDIEKS